MACWMCEEPRFRSACAHHPVGIRPLVDPKPELERPGPYRN